MAKLIILTGAGLSAESGLRNTPTVKNRRRLFETIGDRLRLED
jgi:NAD-dependent SIR2 family protein deacetylase